MFDKQARIVGVARKIRGMGTTNLAVEEMTADEVLEYLKSLERVKASADAGEARAMARLFALRPDTAPYVGDEIAAELTWTPRYASNRLGTALELVNRLPNTLDALGRGEIDQAKAATIAHHTEVLATPEVVKEVEAAILPYAPTRTVKLIREKLRRAVYKVDPAGATERHQRRVRDRSVDFFAEDDGMATMFVYGSAETVRPIFDLIDCCARSAKANGADGHLGMLRLDALADLLLGDHLQNLMTEIRVTVPASSLTGMSTVPGELHGYGPLTNDVLHKLADGPNVFWRRIVTDPLTGAVLDVGARRRHTVLIGEHVRTRDKRCVFPGCTRPAEACQIDHSDDYARGGSTSVTNLGALCQRHNLIKLEGGWSLSQPEPGRFVWTSPTGATFGVVPEPLVDPTHDPEPEDATEPPPCARTALAGPA